MLLFQVFGKLFETKGAIVDPLVAVELLNYLILILKSMNYKLQFIHFPSDSLDIFPQRQEKAEDWVVIGARDGLDGFFVLLQEVLKDQLEVEKEATKILIWIADSFKDEMNSIAILPVMILMVKDKLGPFDQAFTAKWLADWTLNVKERHGKFVPCHLHQDVVDRDHFFESVHLLMIQRQLF